MLTRTSTRTGKTQPMGHGSRSVVAAGTVIFVVLCIFAGLESVATAWSGAFPAIESGAFPAIEMVDRTRKGDRGNSSHAPAPNRRLIEGCEALVSSLTDSVLAQIEGRCAT
jgi:hypothetical protein